MEQSLTLWTLFSRLFGSSLFIRARRVKLWTNHVYVGHACYSHKTYSCILSRQQQQQHRGAKRASIPTQRLRNTGLTDTHYKRTHKGFHWKRFWKMPVSQHIAMHTHTAFIRKNAPPPFSLTHTRSYFFWGWWWCCALLCHAAASSSLAAGDGGGGFPSSGFRCGLHESHCYTHFSVLCVASMYVFVSKARTKCEVYTVFGRGKGGVCVLWLVCFIFSFRFRLLVLSVCALYLLFVLSLRMRFVRRCCSDAHATYRIVGSFTQAATVANGAPQLPTLTWHKTHAHMTECNCMC